MVQVSQPYSRVVNTTALYTATLVFLDMPHLPHNRCCGLPNALPALARRDAMSLSAEIVLDKKLPS